MSHFRRFAERLHSIRETVQRQEEVELARVTQEHRATMERLEAVHGIRFAAAEMRNGQGRGADVAMWHHYVVALERKELEEQERLHTVQQRVDDQRGRVRLAYQDSRRWEIMVDSLRDRERTDSVAKLQKDADDMAVQRANRGQLK